MKKYKYKLYGAILGDLAGQPYEYKYEGDFSEFQLHDPKSTITDDTIMTLATAATLLGDFPSFEIAYKAMFEMYPGNFYGNQFREWCATPKGTISDSYGNGCLMRVSPIMYKPTMILVDLFESVRCSHRHEKSFLACLKLYEGYQGIENEEDPHFVRQGIFEIEADKTASICLSLLRQDLSTQEGIKIAVKLGGDTDTNASIYGELANSHYKDITEKDAAYVESKLDGFLLNILKRFNEKF